MTQSIALPTDVLASLVARGGAHTCIDSTDSSVKPYRVITVAQCFAASFEFRALEELPAHFQADLDLFLAENTTRVTSFNYAEETVLTTCLFSRVLTNCIRIELYA